MKNEFVSAENAVLPCFSEGDVIRFRLCDGGHWKIGKVLSYVDPGDETEGYYKLTDGGKVYCIPVGRVTYTEYTKRGW